MLENQGLRAARLVTDSGIHALGWTREQAVDTLIESGQTRTDSGIEIDRYIGMPGQALCYMTGMIEIQRARASESARLGADFSLRDFHDRVLALGEVPLPSFRRVFSRRRAAPARLRACRATRNRYSRMPRSQSSSACAQHRAGGEPLGASRPRSRSVEPHARRTGTPGRSPARPRACADARRNRPPRTRVLDLAGVAAACRPDPPQAEHRDARRAPRGAPSGNRSTGTSLIVSTPPGRSTRNASAKNVGARREVERRLHADHAVERLGGERHPAGVAVHRRARRRRRGARARPAAATA